MIETWLTSENPEPRLFSYDLWKKFLGEDDLFTGVVEEYRTKFSYRSNHIERFGFPILTNDSISTLSSYLKNMKVVDLGCGTGYLVWALKSKGVNIVGVDNFSSTYSSTGTFEKHQYAPAINADILGFDISSYDVVIMSWPDYGSPTAHSIAKKLKSGQIFIYQGEGYGGCTADDAFHDLVSDEAEFVEIEDVSELVNAGHVQFFGLHDRWFVYQKL
jgi:SAM-dependent methyltransferase